MTGAQQRNALGNTDEVLPGRVSVKNSWALLRKVDKVSAIFYYDQLKIRYQYAIRSDYNPRPSWWKKKEIVADIERLFEDVDEEIYFEEQLVKTVKGTEDEKKKALARAQKGQEDLEEAIIGYDKFTVEEEKKIKEMSETAIKKMERAEEEREIV